MKASKFSNTADLKLLYGIQGLSIPWLEYEGKKYSTILNDEEYDQYAKCWFEDPKKIKAASTRLLKNSGGMEYLSFQIYGEPPSIGIHRAGESPVRPFTLESVKQPLPDYEKSSRENVLF